MTEAAPSHLNFGHLGTAAYDPLIGEWNFSRKPDRKELRQLGSWTTAIPAAIQFPTPSLARAPGSLQQTTKKLVRDYPDLAAAAAQLPELEIVSAATTYATASYDAAVGCLLSFGWVARPGGERRVVVALPAGEAGNVLRVQVLVEERHGWVNDRSVWLSAPSMTGGESGFWNDAAAPIQQICFAQAEARHSFLAVRLPSQTVLFRPTYAQGRVPAPSSELYELPPSSVYVRPIHSILVADTGSAPHADVTFNPNYQRQLGIVDQQGRWTIWDMEGGHQVTPFTVKRTLTGSIASADDLDSNSAGNVKDAMEDGWARILWVSNANTIVVCSRRRIKVFDIKGKPIELECPPLTPTRSADWILDVKPHPKIKDQCFVLTTTRLLLIAVTPWDHDLVPDSQTAGARILISWAHFRGCDDITLHLCVHSSDEESIILLYSRLNYLVTVYRFGVTATATDRPFSSSDPTTLVLDWPNSASVQPCISQFHLERYHFGTRRGPQHPGIAQEYLEEEVAFYQLSAVLSDLGVCQIMLYSVPDTARRKPLSIKPTSWVTIMRNRGKNNLSSALVEVEDEYDFVDQSDVPATAVPRLKGEQQPRNGPGLRVSDTPKKVLDYSSLYETLVGRASVVGSRTNTVLEYSDFQSVFEGLEQVLADESMHGNAPLGILSDISGINITVSDIDEASSRLQHLLSLNTFGHKIELRKIASDQALDLLDGRAQPPLTALAIYDQLLDTWVASLPGDIPVRVRQQKELLARRMAVELMLSIFRIRRSEDPSRPVDPHSVPSQDIAISLPTLPSRPQPSQAPSSQSSYPMSSISEEPVVPGSSPPASEPLKRLAEHLHVDKRMEAVPPSVAGVLTHWEIGSDPRAYDWEAAESGLGEDAEMDHEQSQERREKRRRRRERLEKRQQRENNMFRAQTSSQPHFARSSPGPAVVVESSQPQAQSQSQTFSGLFIQSQVEAGRYGSRPAKKKGKGRVSGF